MPITPDISKKLLELKEESGLSLDQIGQKVGTSGVNVSRYIKGETKTPDRQLLYAIIRAIGGDPDEVFGRKKPDPPVDPKPGIAYDLYEKLEDRRREELANMRLAYENTIQTKDLWIERVKQERDEAEAEVDKLEHQIQEMRKEISEVRQEKRHLKVAVLVLSALAFLFLALYLIPDILRGDWGHIIYSVFPNS